MNKISTFYKPLCIIGILLWIASGVVSFLQHTNPDRLFFFGIIGNIIEFTFLILTLTFFLLCLKYYTKLEGLSFPKRYFFSIVLVGIVTLLPCVFMLGIAVEQALNPTTTNVNFSIPVLERVFRTNEYTKRLETIANYLTQVTGLVTLILIWLSIKLRKQFLDEFGHR
jgi:hypothetical protein